LVLIIITFFLPFFSVSCSRQDSGVTFSGFELSTGINLGEYSPDGSFFGFILIIPPVILLILSFLIYKTKRISLYKTIFFIAPVFDIFAVFIIRYAFNAVVKNRLGEIPVLIDIKYGFILYLIFNAAVFVFAVINYFIKRE
jgi:hypothetical protein